MSLNPSPTLSTPVAGNRSPSSCPKCGGPMRYQRSQKSGSLFEGCNSYPKCLGSKSLYGAQQRSDLYKSDPVVQTVDKVKEESALSSPNPATDVEQFVDVILEAVNKTVRDEVALKVYEATRGLGQSRELATQLTQVRQEIQGQMNKMRGDFDALSELLAPVKHEWVVDKNLIAKVEGGTAHAKLPETVKRVAAGLKNILLTGPAGSGKTTLARDLAKALGRPFAFTSCTAGMPEWHLVGRATPNLTNGSNTYQPSDFVKLYETGGFYLLDEVDAADANTLLVLNSALANGHLSLPARVDNPIATRHPDFILIAAANTVGNGATRQYVGRNQLDAAFLSRFACAIIPVDYDQKLERALVKEEAVLREVWRIRAKVVELSLRQVVGTRELLAVARLVALGEPLPAAIKALTVVWTQDERQKVGVY